MDLLLFILITLVRKSQENLIRSNITVFSQKKMKKMDEILQGWGIIFIVDSHQNVSCVKGGNIENKYQMYVVYSQNQSEKKFLDEQFLFQQGSFKVPISSLKSLQDLIGKVSYEFYQHNQSLFIEKLKIFLNQILSMTFSFPLFRELLEISKKKDLASEFYRGHFLAINSILCDGFQDQSVFENDDREASSMLIIEELQQTIMSYKNLETFEMDNEMIITLQGLAESEQLDNPRHLFQVKDQKTTIFNSDRTIDQALEEYCQAVKNQSKSLPSYSDKPKQQLIPPPFRLERCFQSNILGTCSKGPFVPSQKAQESMEEYISSFKKEKGSKVADMIINEQSLGRIARKQNKEKKQRQKLQVELYEKTKSQKSSDYNRNIRSILLNKKLRDKKSKQKYDQKSRQASPSVDINKKRTSSSLDHAPRISISPNNREAKKPMQEVAQCPEEIESSFARGIEPK